MKLANSLASTVQLPLISSANVSPATMAPIALLCVRTGTGYAGTEVAIVDLRDGEENFVKREVVQG